MSVQKTVTKSKDEKVVIRNNMQLLSYAKKWNKQLADIFPYSLAVSSIRGIEGETFSIDANHRIYIPRLEAILHILNNDFKLVPLVVRGGLIHERLHAILFPPLKRNNVILAVTNEYLSSKEIDANTEFLFSILNILSDVINEMKLYISNYPYYEEFAERKRVYFKGFLRDAERSWDNLAHIERLLTKHVIYLGSRKYNINKMEDIYDAILKVLVEKYKDLDIRDHVRSFNSPNFREYIRRLLKKNLLFNKFDNIVDTVKKGVKENDPKTLYDILSKESKNLEPLEFFMGLAVAFYIVDMEKQNGEGEGERSSSGDNRDEKNNQKGKNKKGKDKKKRVDSQVTARLRLGKNDMNVTIPSKGILKAIFSALVSDGLFIPSELAEEIAKVLIGKPLLIRSNQKYIDVEVEKMNTRVPWYRYPRGKIDPRSLLLGDPLKYKSIKPRYEFRSVERIMPKASIPTKISVVMDVSGSTSLLTNILTPSFGVDTTVVDVERIVIMSLLYNVMNFDKTVPTNLITFSNTVEIKEDTVENIYKVLRDVKFNPEMGGTDIVSAIRTVVRKHEDGETNYVLIVTDMEITSEDARLAKQLITTYLPRSPVMILAINSSNIPSELEKLNNYRNVAVVSVRDERDYEKLKKAIRKLASII